MRPACLVLCYHRVSDETADYWQNAVSLRNFSNQIALLCSRYRVISIDDLTSALERDRTPGFRSVVITFDDGYSANVVNACETLAKLSAPATFYLNTAWLDGELFWWDELVLALNGAKDAGGHQTPAAWLCREANIAPKDSSKDAAIAALRNAFKEMHDDRRRELLRGLRQAFPASDRPTVDYAPIKTADIKAIASDSLFTIAAHTHSHPVLARLPLERQRPEIQENKRILEGIVGRTVTHFSYPFGGADDFNEGTIQELRSAGFRSATTTAGLPARWPCDPFRIPRLSMKNWGTSKFEAELRDAWAQ
jgi:peptidoglycan/xylan/chitin deacetylase (PgdA/CDA1 family)